MEGEVESTNLNVFQNLMNNSINGMEVQLVRKTNDRLKTSFMLGSSWDSIQPYLWFKSAIVQ